MLTVHHPGHSKDEYYSHCLNLLRCILASLEMNAITLKILIPIDQCRVDTLAHCHTYHCQLLLMHSPLTQCQLQVNHTLHAQSISYAASFDEHSSHLDPAVQ